LSTREAITGLYERGGFSRIEFEHVQAPLGLPTADDCLAFERESFGALHQMLASLDDPSKEAAWEEVRAALRTFEGPNGFEGPCELVIAVGTKAG
jgi:hypothetical protein